MIQKGSVQYELVFDFHELTNNYETKEKATWPYIDYICAVVNMYAHMCLGGNTKAIRSIIQMTGIDETFIIQTISQDMESIKIHEKLKQAFMFLTRVLFIENDPISPGINRKNRCYVWDQLEGPAGLNEHEKAEQYFEDEGDEVVNHHYKGGAYEKKIQIYLKRTKSIKEMREW